MRARSAGSGGRPRSSTSAAASCSTSSLVATPPGRAAGSPPSPSAWRAGIAWATLDLSASYRTVFDTMLPDAVQVADPFHVVRVANTALDECRRRVQNDTVGHRGRKPDPLYRARRLLTMAAERLPDDRRERLVGLLAAGDPKGEVKLTWHAKEVVRQIYDHTDPELAEAWVDEIIRDFADPEMPLEVRRLGRTIKRWRDQIVAWHRSHVSNGPTEAINNLVKRVKRVAFGMRRFRNYRIRALLYAGTTQLDPPRHAHPTMKSEEPVTCAAAVVASGCTSWRSGRPSSSPRWQAPRVCQVRCCFCRSKSVSSGHPSPAVTPTNLVYNVVATPGALGPVLATGPDRWTTHPHLAARHRSGNRGGVDHQSRVVPGPRVFEGIIALVLVPLGAWLVLRGGSEPRPGRWNIDPVPTGVRLGAGGLRGWHLRHWRRLDPRADADQLRTVTPRRRSGDARHDVRHVNRWHRDVRDPVDQRATGSRRTGGSGSRSASVV